MIPAGYEMLVRSEDRVQANTVIARAYAPDADPQEFLAAIDGNITSSRNRKPVTRRSSAAGCRRMGG